MGELALIQAETDSSRQDQSPDPYNGAGPSFSGFWAKDRPNEERIDPLNMKIYSWRTYKLRFPFQHTWQTETQWKKLPLAPKSVHRVPREPSLLEDASGSKLVDEQNREFKW